MDHLDPAGRALRADALRSIRDEPTLCIGNGQGIALALEVIWSLRMYTGVVDLQAAFSRDTAGHYARPRPFTRTKLAADMLKSQAAPAV